MLASGNMTAPPPDPTVHPHNHQTAAAMRRAHDHHPPPPMVYHHPYLQYSPVEKPSNNSLESLFHAFDSWNRKAEIVSRNFWNNLKLTTKAMTRGGFVSLYKQNFATDPNEMLKETFACYLSTSTGPFAGTLFLSTVQLAFCSYRPLSFYYPSGQLAWSYYKVVIPLRKIGAVNPVTMRENPWEKYIQMVTIDGHEFWFMRFVNYENATQHILSSVSDFRAQENGVNPGTGGSSS